MRMIYDVPSYLVCDDCAYLQSAESDGFTCARCGSEWNVEFEQIDQARRYQQEVIDRGA